MSKKRTKTLGSAFLCLFTVFCFNVTVFGQNETAVPVQAPAQEQAARPSLCINGIIFGQNPVAVINGESYKPGDLVAGARIASISETSVEFEFNGSVFSQSLGDGCGTAATKAIEKTIEQATRQIQSNIPLPKQKSIAVSPRLKLDPKAMDEVMKAGAATLGLALFFGLLIYIYGALTLQLVAKKTGASNGWLAWIPVANIFLSCTIAHRPLWWAVLLVILPVTIIGIIPWLIMVIVVLMDIAAACNKPKWIALIAVLPPISSVGWLFYWGYLAFSKMPEATEAPIEHITEARAEVVKPELPKADTSVPKPAEPVKPESAEKPAENKPTSTGRQPDKPTDAGVPKDPPIYNG